MRHVRNHLSQIDVTKTVRPIKAVMILNTDLYIEENLLTPTSRLVEWIGLGTDTVKNLLKKKRFEATPWPSACCLVSSFPTVAARQRGGSSWRIPQTTNYFGANIRKLFGPHYTKECTANSEQCTVLSVKCIQYTVVCTPSLGKWCLARHTGPWFPRVVWPSLLREVWLSSLRDVWP